jgi:hypothetical protein
MEFVMSAARVLFHVVLATALAAPALAGAPRSGAPIAGYLDLRTGIFYPVDQSSAASLAAAITRTGSWSVEATVRIDPSIPTSATLTANFTASVADPVTNVGAYYNYTARGSGTMKRTGNVATITLHVPYIWRLAHPTDVVSIQFTVSADSATSPMASFMQTVPLPASGKTTQVAIGDAI